MHCLGAQMTETKGAAVRYENVQKSYDGETLVVKNLNLDIPPGEFLTMLGPSGSGKTTLVRALLGAVAPGLEATGSVPRLRRRSLLS